MVGILPIWESNVGAETFLPLREYIRMYCPIAFNGKLEKHEFDIQSAIISSRCA
jgi:hypothetical protein